MRAALATTTGMLWTKQYLAAIGCGGVWNQSLRWMVGKASNRAAVHGSKLPIPDTVDKEEVEAGINRGKEEKERRRKEIEKNVDSQLQGKQVLSVEKLVGPA